MDMGACRLDWYQVAVISTADQLTNLSCDLMLAAHDYARNITALPMHLAPGDPASPSEQKLHQCLSHLQSAHIHMSTPHHTMCSNSTHMFYKRVELQLSL